MSYKYCIGDWVRISPGIVYRSTMKTTHGLIIDRYIVGSRHNSGIWYEVLSDGIVYPILEKNLLIINHLGEKHERNMEKR